MFNNKLGHQKPYRKKFREINWSLIYRSDLNSAHWMTEIEGLGAIVRLMKYHSDIVLPDINELIHALNHECKNLRSQVISQKKTKKCVNLI